MYFEFSGSARLTSAASRVPRAGPPCGLAGVEEDLADANAPPATAPPITRAATIARDRLVGVSFDDITATAPFGSTHPQRDKRRRPWLRDQQVVSFQPPSWAEKSPSSRAHISVHPAVRFQAVAWAIE